MDGDSVIDTDEPSQTSFASKSYTEIFIDAFPQYLVMGMTYEQYWYGHAWLVVSYRKAMEMKHREEEYARWRQGMYFYDALTKIAPAVKAFSKVREFGKYPEEPWPVNDKEARERERAKEIAKFKKMLAMMNKESEVNIKKRAEEETAKKKEASSDA